MNKYLLLIFAVFLIACSNTKKPKETVIKGSFPGFKDSLVYFYNNGSIDTIYLDKDKSFTRILSIEKPNFYMVKAMRARNYFFAKPYDTTSFILDCSVSGKVPEFKGEYADMNNYLPRSYKVMKDLYNDWDGLFSIEKPDFDKKIDSVEKLLFAVLDSVTIKDQELQSLEKSHLDYFIKSVKIEYVESYPYIKGKELNHDSADYSFLKDMDINNSYHLMFDDYTSNVDKYVMHLFMLSSDKEKYNKKTDPEKKKEYFAFIDNKITSQPVRDLIKMNSLKEDLTYGKFFELGEVVNKYLSECKNQECKRFISNLYNKRMMIAPGKKAPEFKYKDIKETEIALADFKGELVYIDFWATW